MRVFSIQFRLEELRNSSWSAARSCDKTGRLVTCQKETNAFLVFGWNFFGGHILNYLLAKIQSLHRTALLIVAMLVKGRCSVA